MLATLCSCYAGQRLYSLQQQGDSMANSYIRIYDKPNDGGTPATWLGLSATPAYDLRERESEFSAFFQERGFSIKPVDPEEAGNRKRMRSLGGVSWEYREVTPPLPEDLFAELGKICEKLVDPGPNSGVLMDNRNDPVRSTRNSLASQVIYSW